MPLKMSTASGATELRTRAPPGSTEVLTGWQCELGEPAQFTDATRRACKANTELTTTKQQSQPARLHHTTICARCPPSDWSDERTSRKVASRRPVGSINAPYSLVRGVDEMNSYRQLLSSRCKGRHSTHTYLDQNHPCLAGQRQSMRKAECCKPWQSRRKTMRSRSPQQRKHNQKPTLSSAQCTSTKPHTR